MKKRSDYIPISKETLEELYFEKGLKQREIAAIFGVNPKTIGNRMAEYGLVTRGHEDYVYVNIPKSELERLYLQENRTAPEIADIYHCAASVVYLRLREHGIAIKQGGWDKVKQIVPSARLLWSPEFAYVVGLIASDGNLQSNSNEVRLASTDREIVDHYCRCLGLRPDDVSAEEWGDLQATQVHIRIEQRASYKKQYHIIFSDHLYRARLEEIGLTPNKSNTIGALSIPDQYFRDFLRGEFDGDGCWSADRRRLQKQLLGLFTSGSLDYLEWLKATVLRLAGIKGRIYRINLWYEAERAKQLGEFMYHDANVPCLTRKRAKWERLRQ